MIYLIQPMIYPGRFRRLIEEYVSAKQEGFSLQHTAAISSGEKNAYFVINDRMRKDWDGLRIARQIREKDAKGSLILISNDLDYQRFFRTHLSFLEVIDMEDSSHIKECLDYLLI